MEQSNQYRSETDVVRQNQTRSYSSSDMGRADNVSTECEIVEVGRRRDGRMRYWCLKHRADATLKYGERAHACSASDTSQIDENNIFTLNVDGFAGGIALWGAAAPVYDTTALPLERGIHLHARYKVGDTKEIDATFRAIKIIGLKLPEGGILISEADAIHYLVSSILGVEIKYIACTYCNHPHLDQDLFSVHPHRRHLCAACGRFFQDSERGIGNPICGLREACGVKVQPVMRPANRIDIRQDEYPGGIQIWGSNPALVWTCPTPEAEGIHVHAFKSESEMPLIDETYSEVTIDGKTLDPRMVRVLMAQESLPSLKGRAVELVCQKCNERIFEDGVDAISPRKEHLCRRCGRQLRAKGQKRKTMGNPLVGILARLSINAPRAPQSHRLSQLRHPRRRGM